MQSAGAELVKHYRDLAFMGFAEVIKNLPTIFKNIRYCKEDILSFKPDAVILIDYPGFNLRIAEWAHQEGIKVIYYISPQVWAWKEGRVKKMKQIIDKMLVILPFEKDYYKEKWNWEVDYVGHPLIEAIEDKKKELGYIENNASAKTKKIALLPGSRKQEISKKLPIMLEVAKSFPDYQFVVAEAPGQESAFYQPFLQAYQNVSSVQNATYQLLIESDAALVTSGTATLETALLGVPEIVCYKGSNISYQIAKRLIKIKYISLVNLIMDKLIVTELIQDELNVANLVKELNTLLKDAAHQKKLKADYQALYQKLSKGGHASDQAANIIVNFLHK
jgi:lipid-A-disaccharide synthase